MTIKKCQQSTFHAVAADAMLPRRIIAAYRLFFDYKRRLCFSPRHVELDDSAADSWQRYCRKRATR